MKKIFTAAALIICLAGTANAHFFWINSHESFNHPPGHAIFSLGFGHELPVGDLLSGEFGSIEVDSYRITGPDGRVFNFENPDTKRRTQKQTVWESTIEDGDLGLRKMALTENTAEGVYTVTAEMVPSFFTIYIDKSGRQKVGRESKDKTKGAEKIISSMKYGSFAKTYLTIGDWKQPEPVKADLDIIPLTDLSSVKKGDIVEFETRFNGKLLSTSFSGLEYMTAFGSNFGAHDGFQLFSLIKNGRSQFRVLEKGEWVVSVFVEKDVADDPSMKNLQGKTDTVYYNATLTFNVNE